MVLLLAFSVPEAFSSGTEGQGVFLSSAAGFPVDTRRAGGLAPAFTLETLDGGEASLKDYRGSVVLIHFWASWCKPCKQEFPKLGSLVKRLGKRGVVVLAVAEDTPGRAGEFADRHGLDMPVLIDRYGSVMRAYGVRVIPATFIVDRNGNIAGVAMGARDWSAPEAFEFIERILDQGL